MLGPGARLVKNDGISVSAFYDALSTICLRKFRKVVPKLVFGIAVSGGVDSMALAKLCSMLRQDRFASQTYNFYFHVFIVDHKAREGSEVEAAIVKDRITSMGINAQILDLQWPPNVRPLDLPDFETQARRQRYQALGAACRTRRISRLLLAHHADDQAETILMRLANSQKGVGLSGIRARSDIPECWGMHRIHQSGYYEQAAETLVSWTASGRGVPSNERALRLQQSVSSTPIFEGGGVEIIRPLLKFGKQDLVSTCVAHGVTWTEDETNKDVWRTPRNATRSLLGKCRLPKALSRDPLIRLSRRMVAKHVVHKLSATRSFMRCEILLFDLRSGSIVVRLPEIDDIGVNFTAVSMAHLASKPLVASLLLQRLTSQITPHEGVPLHSLQVAVDAMFPELRYQEKNDLGKKKSPSRFTAAGVQFDRLPSPLVDVASDERSIQLAGTPQPLSHGPDRQHSWSLTRQPFMNKRASSKSQSSENTLPTILISTSPTVSESNSFPWSSWSLWDGRYWIRVKNSTVQTLQVRPFREVDLKAIRKSLPKSRLKPLEEVLASAAPNKVRFTLPVISEASKDMDKPGKVLALPTLGLVGQLKVESGQGVRNLEWEIRYKDVDLGCNEEGDRRENKNIITSWRDS